jgi:hypothetical protein
VQQIIRMPLPDMPENCGSCGYAGDDWPLGIYGGRLYLFCRDCHVVVAPVTAVRLDAATVAAIASQLTPEDQDTVRDELTRAAEQRIWGDEQ